MQVLGQKNAQLQMNFTAEQCDQKKTKHRQKIYKLKLEKSGGKGTRSLGIIEWEAETKKI